MLKGNVWVLNRDPIQTPRRAGRFTGFSPATNDTLGKGKSPNRKKRRELPDAVHKEFATPGHRLNGGGGHTPGNSSGGIHRNAKRPTYNPWDGAEAGQVSRLRRRKSQRKKS
jgi:hypothetical protein